MCPLYEKLCGEKGGGCFHGFSWRKGDQALLLGDGGAPPLLLKRVGRAGCDLFEVQLQTSGSQGSWLKNKLGIYGEFIWFFGFVGSSQKLGRQIRDAVEVMRALESLLVGWSCSAHGCPEDRSWEPGLWPADLGISACLFELHKHLRSQNAGGSKFRLPGRCLRKQNKPAGSQEPHPSPKRLSLPSSFLASGFPCVWGVRESWKWGELYCGVGRAVGEQRRLK